MLVRHFNLYWRFTGGAITSDFKLAFFPLNVMFLTFKISPILLWKIFISQEFLQEKHLTTGNLQWNFEQRVATQLPLAGKSQPEFAQPSDVNDRDWELLPKGSKSPSFTSCYNMNGTTEREEERKRERDWEREVGAQGGRREGGKEVNGVHFLNYSAPEWGERWGQGPLAGWSAWSANIARVYVCFQWLCTRQKEKGATFQDGNTLVCLARLNLLLVPVFINVCFSLKYLHTHTFSKVLLFMDCWMECRSKWLLSLSSRASPKTTHWI